MPTYDSLNLVIWLRPAQYPVGGDGRSGPSDRAFTQRHIVLAVFTDLGRLPNRGVHVFRRERKMMRDPPPRPAAARGWPAECHLSLFMASVVFSTATGAAHWRSGQPGTVHLLAAGTALIVQLFCWFVDSLLVVEHSLVFDRVMREYGARKTSACPPKEGGMSALQTERIRR